MPLELAGEMGLIEEADTRRHQRDRFPVQEAPAGGVDAAGHDVLVRSDPKGLREASDEVGR
jgi:hypothetical protein